MLEQLAKHIFDDLNSLGARLSKDQSEGASLIKSLLESRLRKLNLVTREEFDAQQSVLTKSLEQLAALEQKIEQLENQLRESKPTSN